MTSMIALRRRRRPEWSGRQPKVENDARDAEDVRKRIAYVVNCFPFPTETFVYRELLALRAHGCTILPFSLQSPDPATLSSEALRLVDETYSIQPAPLAELLAAHARWIARSPVLYLSTLWTVVTGTHLALRDRLRSFAHWAEAISILPVLEQARVDHIHAHFAVGSATCAWVAARLLGLPWSFTAHAYDIWLDKLLLPEKLREADFVVTCSDVNRRHLAETYGVPLSKLHTVYHGIDVGHFSPMPKPSSAHPEKLRVLCVGRLVEQKGIAHLIEACSQLAIEGIEFELLIAGDGPLRESLRQACRELRIDDRTQFLGHVSQETVLELYRSSDLFVLPCVAASDGDRDGVPNVLIEAMACGLCVVSTEFSGVPELVENGKSGALVSPGDSRGLARAMGRMLADENLRKAMAMAGRATVVERFAIDVSARALLDLTAWDEPIPRRPS